MSHWRQTTPIERLPHSLNSPDHAFLTQGTNWKLTGLMCPSFHIENDIVGDLTSSGHRNLLVVSTKLLGSRWGHSLESFMLMRPPSDMWFMRTLVRNRTWWGEERTVLVWPTRDNHLTRPSASWTSWNIQKSQECCGFPRVRKTLSRCRKRIANRFVAV